MQPTTATKDSVLRWAARRASINRANAQHSTGPRTEEGKRRSSRNALGHGLTAQTAVLPDEDPEAYNAHCRSFFDEYHPETATETHLVQELADTSWRLRRIPLLEAGLLSHAANPPSEEAAMAFDIVDAHQALARLSLHSARLSRQFQKALETLRELQDDRQRTENRELREAAALLEFHKHKGLPWEPSDHGFVFSKPQVECFAERLMRQKEARHVEYVKFDMLPVRLHWDSKFKRVTVVEQPSCPA